MSTDTPTNASVGPLEQSRGEQPVLHGDGPAAGWYPDPNTESLLRWWDGTAWTLDVRSFDDADQIAAPTVGQSLAVEPTGLPPTSSSATAKWAGLAVALVTALVLVLVGLGNGREVEIVDQARSLQPTGEYNVVETSEPICAVGDDYLNCINRYFAHANSVCVGQPLTSSGEWTCRRFQADYEEMLAGYEDECDYGCTVSGPGGWSYLRLEAAEKWVPAVTHTERCSFDLGVIQIGTCTT